MKATCCKRYKRKGKACKKCPRIAALSDKQVRKLLKNAKRSS